MTADLIGKTIRHLLDAGHTLEIEGLGSFRARKGSGYEFVPQSAAQVFIAYAVEDLPVTKRLCDSLRAHDCSPWMDKEKILPGQNWPRAIERAIEISDAFIACFSSHSVLKRGQFQSELRYALDCARRCPLESTFFIPVRFDDCAVPRSIAGRLQYVDLFQDWDKGIRRIMKAVRRAASMRPNYLLSANI